MLQLEERINIQILEVKGLKVLVNFVSGIRTLFSLPAIIFVLIDLQCIGFSLVLFFFQLRWFNFLGEYDSYPWIEFMLPVMNITIKLVDLFFFNLAADFLEEHRRVLDQRLQPVIREITDSRARTRDELEGLYYWLSIELCIFCQSSLGDKI